MEIQIKNYSKEAEIIDSTIAYLIANESESAYQLVQKCRSLAATFRNHADTDATEFMFNDKSSITIRNSSLAEPEPHVSQITL